MRITRREWLMVAGSFFSGAVLGESVFGGSHRKRHTRGRRRLRSRGVRGARVHNAAGVSEPLPGAKLFEDVIAYYNLGEHRTATETDLKTSQWLADQLRAARLATTFQSFSLRPVLRSTGRSNDRRSTHSSLSTLVSASHWKQSTEFFAGGV